MADPFGYPQIRIVLPCLLVISLLIANVAQASQEVRTRTLINLPPLPSSNSTTLAGALNSTITALSASAANSSASAAAVLNTSAITHALNLAATVSALLGAFPANLTGNLSGSVTLPDAAGLLKLEQYVLSLVRPVLTSFLDESNQSVDCVNFTDQLARINPRLANHTFQLNLSPGSTNPTDLVGSLPGSNGSSLSNTSIIPSGAVVGSPRASGECPAGTVPVPRVTLADVARFPALWAFLNITWSGNATEILQPSATAPSLMEGAHEFVTFHSTKMSSKVDLIYGARSTASVWQPLVQYRTADRPEFSLSFVSVSAGFGAGYEWVEAGWIVWPYKFGDNKPHLYIFSNGGRGTCYAGAKDCPAGEQTFVQTSRKAYPLMPLSASTGVDPEVVYSFLIHQDSDTGHWWVQLNDEPVGYYPGTLFTALAGSANTIAVGGEILNSAKLSSVPPGQTHTRTQMGSGHWGSELNPRTTAYHFGVQNVDNQGRLSAPLNADTLFLNDNLQIYDPTCYNGRIGIFKGGDYFFFGGPGTSAYCF